MVHYEFGVFVLFSTTPPGSLGPFCKITSIAPLSLEARFSPRFSGCPEPRTFRLWGRL